MQSPKIALDKMIFDMGGMPTTPVDRPKADIAVQLAKNFKNSVSFGNGGIRLGMDSKGNRFTKSSRQEDRCTGSCDH